MSGSIHLIAESDEDIEIVRAVLQASGYTIRVVRATTKRTGGLSVMVKHLERSILDATAKRNPETDCIAVLRDEDSFREPRRALYDQCDAICRRHKVKRAIAINHIEAWILGDEGICNWLGIASGNYDNTNAKAQLNSLVKRKTKYEFSGSNRATVLSHLNGINHSTSLRDALKILENAPCTTEI